MCALLFAHFGGIGQLRARPRAPLPPLRSTRPRVARFRVSAASQFQPESEAVPRTASDYALRNSANLTRQPRQSRPLLLLCAAAVGVALLRVRPVLAAVGSGLAGAGVLVEPTGFLSGLTASFALVLASEIGDKTFFISALLSMKYSRLLVLLGTMLALGTMTVISVGIGQLFHAVPTTLKLAFPIDDYAAIALLVYFGVQNIRDSFAMAKDGGEELEGAKEVVATGSENAKSNLRVVTETSSLVFFAEWGDKSMLATVALAAAKSPLGVIAGGVSGHLIATIIAVLGGSFLGKYISEKNARLVGGILFLAFAVLTFIGIW